MKDWVDQAGAAERLGVDRSTLSRWHERGCPRPTKRRRTGKGHPLIYTAEDIERIRAWAEGSETR